MLVSLNNIIYSPKYKNSNKKLPVSYKNYSDNVVNLNFGNSIIPQSVLRRKTIEDRINLLTPIKTKEEYDEIIKEILGYKLFNYTPEKKSEKNNILFGVFGDEYKKNPIDIDYMCTLGYSNAKDNFIGLIPYCGFADISYQINAWLSGRNIDNPTLLNDRQMANVVRAFEYSLSRLDMQYGKYSGTVYRAGYFDPVSDKQYYSSSDYLSCAIEHSNTTSPSEILPYSIIKLKKGHYIHKFQKDVNSMVSSTFALCEREILIDRKSRFRKVPVREYSEYDISLVKDVILRTIDCEFSDLTDKQRREIINNISVWEEI